MSLTSYRAAPPRVSWVVVEEVFYLRFAGLAATYSPVS